MSCSGAALALQLALVLHFGCGKSEEPIATPSGSGSAPAPFPAGSNTAPTITPASEQLCALGVAAIDATRCDVPKLGMARTALANLQGALKKGSTSDHETDAACGQLIQALERDLAKAKCTLALDAAGRTRLDRVMKAWYGRRTAVAPTGDRDSDAMIGRLAAVRDAACECGDSACIDGLTKQLKEVGALRDTATTRARTLASELLRDISRCTTRVRTTGP
jgi:hypothetical protein